MVKMERIEQLRLADNIAEYLGENISETEAKELIKASVDESKVDILFDFFLKLSKEWDSNAILIKSWDIYKNKLLKAYKKIESPSKYVYNFDNLIQGSASKFWRQCVCLLALWKFPICEHQKGFTYSLRIREDLEGILDGYDEKAAREIADIWNHGQEWLDDKAASYGWCLPVVNFNGEQFQDMNNLMLAVNEQAMYLFVRSHLAWQEGKMTREVPLEPIRFLIGAQPANKEWWPDTYLFCNPAGPYCPSLRATTLAIIGLAHWAFHSSNYKNKNDEYIDLVAKTHCICKKAIEKLIRFQLPSGAWPRELNAQEEHTDTVGDIRATSQALYALGRFAERYEITVPDKIYNDAEDWLRNQVNKIIMQKSTKEWDIELVAQAIPVLTRKYLRESTLWLRSAMKYLLNDSMPAGDQAQREISDADAWRLYGVIELIRRESTVRTLDRLI